MIKKFAKLFFLATLLFSDVVVWYAVSAEDQHGMLTVAFLDVGEGEAIYVRTPDGDQILIDGGPDAGVIRQLSALTPFYDQSLDLVVISNTGESGSIGGLISMLSQYHVDMIAGVSADESLGDESFDAGLSASATGRALVQIIRKKDISEISLRRGIQIQLGRDVALTVLFPDRDLSDLPAGDTDEESLVMKLDYASTSAMLASDAPANIQEYLAELDGRGVEGALADALKSDILSVPHEGAATSTSPDFVRTVSPNYAVISAAAGNRYGYPREQTLDVLNANGAKNIKILTTLGRGSIIFQSDGKRWTERQL